MPLGGWRGGGRQRNHQSGQRLALCLCLCVCACARVRVREMPAAAEPVYMEMTLEDYLMQYCEERVRGRGFAERVYARLPRAYCCVRH